LLARIGRGKGNTKLTRAKPKTEGSLTVIPPLAACCKRAFRMTPLSK
jgi:hypothetical protein